MTAPTATWLSVAEVAARGAISQRSVRLAIRTCERGGRWRGTRLVVRTVASDTGGGTGGISYRVREDSLPAELRGTVPAVSGDGLAPAVRENGPPAVSVAESITRLFRMYAAHRGLALSTVSTYAAAAGDFYARLERGHDLTTRRAARVTQWLSDRWPADLDWPSDIPRPEPRPEPKRGEAA